MAQVGAQYVQAVQPVPVGSLQAFAGANAPTGWLMCDGSSYSTSVYPDLYSVLGYTYGGSGANFNVPDLRGRIPVGKDNMGSTGTAGRMTTGATGSPTWTGSPTTLGSSAGADKHTLTTAQMPSHTHAMNDFGVRADVNNTGNNGFVTTNASSNAAGGGRGNANTGGGEAHPIVQPVLVTNYIIKAYPDVPRSGIALGNTPPIVTALPVNPQFGEVVTYAADATNGIYWNLQYDASGTYPWKFIGGSAFACSPVTATQTTTSTSYTDLSTVGPSFTTSLPGDYSFEMQCLMENGTTGSYASVTLSNNGSSVGTEFYVRMASASITTPASWTTTTTMTTVGHVAKMMYRSITSGTSAFGNRAMYVTPIRVKAA